MSLQLAFLARTSAAGVWCWAGSLAVVLCRCCWPARVQRKRVQAKAQLPAAAVQKRVRAWSQLDFMGKLSHLFSQNSKGKGERQLQARRRRQWCFQDVNEVLAASTNTVHLRCACTLLFPYESACSLPAAAVPVLGAPKDQDSFRGINDGKPVSWTGWCFSLLSFCSLGRTLPVVPRSGCDAICHQTKQGLGLCFFSSHN